VDSHATNEGVAFNLKRFNYEGGTQIRLYEKVLKHGGIKQKNEYDGKDDEVYYESNNKRDNQDDILEDKKRSEVESRNRTVQNIYGIARSNKWDLFLTITFNPDIVDSTNYDEVVKKTQNWLNNVRKRVSPNMKYILVPELHADGKKWHFHGLLADCEELTLIETNIVRNGKIVYNLGNWKYGFTEVTKVEDTRRVSSYISKYITKEVCDVTFGKKRYWASKNCIRAEQVTTHDMIDDIQEYIQKISNEIKHMKTVEHHGQKVYYIEV
jgi:hypothetical protein